VKIEARHVLLFLAVAILMAVVGIGVAYTNQVDVSSLGEYGDANRYVNNVKLEEGSNITVIPSGLHNSLVVAVSDPLVGILIGSDDRLNVSSELDFEQSDGSSLYYNAQLLSAFSASPGASGALLVESDANTLGGYQLNVVSETLYFHIHVASDWDAATDLMVDVTFELNAAGSVGTDTVDLRLVCYYKGDGEASNKTQILEEAVVVGAAAQYTRFSATFIIDWDDVGNVVELHDCMSFQLNLETDTSEVDDVIISHFMSMYETKKPAIEVGGMP